MNYYFFLMSTNVGILENALQISNFKQTTRKNPISYFLDEMCKSDGVGYEF